MPFGDDDYYYPPVGPVGEEAPKQMLRYNTGKPPLSMVPTAFVIALASRNGFNTRLLEDTALVLLYGSQKYARDNWRKGGEWMQVLDCALRHLNKLLRDETHDDETGLHHTAHVACNLAFLAEFIEQKKGTDNRYPMVEKIHRDNITHGSIEKDILWQAYLDLMEFKDGGANTLIPKVIADLGGWYETLLPEERAPVPGTSPYALVQMNEKVS